MYNSKKGTRLCVSPCALLHNSTFSLCNYLLYYIKTKTVSNSMKVQISFKFKCPKS